jgi:hypothetical protein
VTTVGLPATFKAADVLLAEAGYIGELFLRQALFQPDPPDILALQFPHIHADGSADVADGFYQL